MIDSKTVAVVVPAYNEASQIGMVIETMPDFVDRIVIVNDMSKDNTSEAVLSYAEREAYRGRAPIGEYRPEVTDPAGYGRAESVAAAKRREEDRLFTPSEVMNPTPDTDRIILIEHRRRMSPIQLRG